MSYVEVPKIVRLSAIVGKKASLSPHNYHSLIFHASQYKPLSELLAGPPVQGA